MENGSDMTKIEWTDETWNPIIGCTKISPGCKNCYAAKMATRLSKIETTAYYSEVVDENPYRWNGKTSFIESQLEKPLKRKKPTMYFVCSMSDLFHEKTPFEWIMKVYDVMNQTPWHTYQILTKRPERALEFYKWMGENIKKAGFDSVPSQSNNPLNYIDALPNVWLGVTAENQDQANRRIPILLSIPAKIRFVSVEPMLEAVRLDQLHRNEHGVTYFDDALTGFKAHGAGGWYSNKLDWVICGGETGYNARPMHPDWVRNLRDQCQEANVPFLFKQWGEYYPIECSFSWKRDKNGKGYYEFYTDDPNLKDRKPSRVKVFGKDIMHNSFYLKLRTKKAGCLLDGKEYKQFPNL